MEEEELEKKPKPIQNQITYLAETNFRNQKVRFGIKRDDSRRHTYVIGKTGMGKSPLMETVSQEHKHLVASGLIGVFKKLWADSWGPRLEYILRNTILALLDYSGSTLLGVNRMFVDKIYRNKVIAKIQDPVVKAFW